MALTGYPDCDKIVMVMVTTIWITHLGSTSHGDVGVSVSDKICDLFSNFGLTTTTSDFLPLRSCLKPWLWFLPARSWPSWRCWLMSSGLFTISDPFGSVNIAMRCSRAIRHFSRRFLGHVSWQLLGVSICYLWVSSSSVFYTFYLLQQHKCDHLWQPPKSNWLTSFLSSGPRSPSEALEALSEGPPLRPLDQWYPCNTNHNQPNLSLLWRFKV